MEKDTRGPAWRLSTLLMIVCWGCRPTPAEEEAKADADGDGYWSTSFDGEDCDDKDPDIHPGAVEGCDGVDNNCDGDVDEGVTTTFYADRDGDGFGDAGATLEGCEQPDRYVLDATDCDDTEAAVHPAADEICDHVDNNCNADVDEGVTTTFYADRDRDGFGDALAAVEDCAAPAGHIEVAGDCDDDDASSNPDGVEVCGDGADNDCNGRVDDAAPTTWYRDDDGDGYGDADATREVCQQPEGYVAEAGDCVDSDESINPDAGQAGRVYFLQGEQVEDVSADFSGATADAPAEVLLEQWGDLRFCEGTYYTALMVSTTEPVTIGGMGPEVTLLSGGGGGDGVDCGQSSVLSIGNDVGASVEVFGVALRGGCASQGGGVYTGRTNALHLRGCAITGNVAQEGGGLFALDTALEITDCAIEDNLATQVDGSGDVEGGGLWASIGPLTITGARISGNEAVGGAGTYGGGLWLNTSNAIEDTEITDNYSASLGGGLYVMSAGVVELQEVTIAGNTADAAGGGLLLTGSSHVTLSCEEGGGVWANSAAPGGGAYLDEGTSLASQGCDWTGSGENAIDDIYVQESGTSYEVDELVDPDDFSCDPECE